MDSNRNTMMGMPDDTADGTGTDHIWLRYATQFTVDERSYTIDMGIPVPLGADEETRERLLREAEAGMDQLSQHVERRVARLQQNAGTVPGTRTLPPQKSTAAPSHVPMPSAAPVPTSTPPPATSFPATPKPTSTTSTPAAVSRSASQGTAPAASTSAAVPAASAPARETPTGQIPAVQSSQSRQPAQATQSTQPTQKRPVTVPPTRPSIGASMPPSPGLPGGTLQLPQFLQYIKEMGLDARQAMDLLKVKSLSGLNLRDALEQLQHIVMKEGATTPMPTSTPTQSQAPQPQPQAQTQTQTPRPKTGESGAGSNPGSGKQAASNSAPASTGASSTSSNSTRPASAPGPASTPVSSTSPTSPMPSAPRISGSGKSSAGSEPKPVVIQEERAPYRGFDEEEDETELDDFELGIDEEEEEEIGATTRVSLSAGNRRTAEDIVERLREARGSSVVSAQRVIVLHNVIGDQVQPEQLQALIRGIWGATSERKLKNEQAEALISWGKQDTFDTEAEMVLALFEEDANARSDR